MKKLDNSKPRPIENRENKSNEALIPRQGKEEIKNRRGGKEPLRHLKTQVSKSHDYIGTALNNYRLADKNHFDVSTLPIFSKREILFQKYAQNLDKYVSEKEIQK